MEINSIRIQFRYIHDNIASFRFYIVQWKCAFRGEINEHHRKNIKRNCFGPWTKKCEQVFPDLLQVVGEDKGEEKRRGKNERDRTRKEGIRRRRVLLVEKCEQELPGLCPVIRNDSGGTENERRRNCEVDQESPHILPCFQQMKGDKRWGFEDVCGSGFWLGSGTRLGRGTRRNDTDNTSKEASVPLHSRMPFLIVLMKRPIFYDNDHLFISIQKKCSKCINTNGIHPDFVIIDKYGRLGNHANPIYSSVGWVLGRFGI